MIRKLQFPDIRVLLVESQAHMSPLYQLALEDMGFARIISAANTEAALDQMYFNSPGLVILGEALFPKSATEFLDDIRSGKTGAAADVPVLMVCREEKHAAIRQSAWGGGVELVRAPASMEGLRRHALAALGKGRDASAKPVSAQKVKRAHGRSAR